MGEEPPFRVTPGILNAVARISERIGELRSAGPVIPPKLRRHNRVKSIVGSLAIEGNTLSEEQVTAILDGKPVMAPAREVAEVRGAIRAYEALPEWNPFALKDLLAAHALMMGDVLKEAGVLRRKGVGIQKGKQILHIAPPADRVRGLLNDLLAWAESSEFHPLITSSVFHYEFEFIHPFPDGNGRLGRLWQTRMLAEWNPLFYHVPLESVIHDHQQDYYHALSASDQASDSTAFVAFMLEVLEQVLLENVTLNAPVRTPEKTLEKTPEKILHSFLEDPARTLADVAGLIGKSRSAVERAAVKLQKEGRLKRVGPDKGGHWEVLG